MQQQGMGGGGLGIEVTPLARRILVILVGCYIGQLVLGRVVPVEQWFFLWSFDSPNWRPWQLVTHPVFNGTPRQAFIDWLVLFFFLGSVERLMGRARFLRGMAVAFSFAVLVTTLLDIAGVLGSGGMHFGLAPFWMALFLFFGLSMPDARILLMFVLPIKAGWVAWGSGLLGLLYFLYAPGLTTSMALFGWVGAYAWLRGFKELRTHYKARKAARDIQRDLVHLEVLKGGREEDDDEEYIH